MKKIKIFGLIAILALAFASCETKVEDPAGPRDKGVIPEIKDLKPAVYDSNDLENTFIQFTVGAEDSRISEVIVVASYNGDNKRTEVARLSSFPSVVNLPLSEVASKMGMELMSIKAADVITIELITVQGSESYFSSAAFRAGVVCGYDVNIATGSFHAVSEGWGLDGNVTITSDPENEFILYVSGLAAIEGLNETGSLKMVVNEDNFSIIAEKSVLAPDVAPWGLPYTGYNYQGFGELNTCDGTYTMTFTIGIDQGSWGAFDFVFTKN
ncbi:hypothetical protein SAMN05444274_102166 [Mariniphaga anaerophila]|uniref:Uncharacterized protein n=1 Tax=Mariniphaga anaerophila TaxID=1484053 RepID=A0A1M4VQ60_9BACT|nr:hypothetical protein [Mariniphaga anaerophila]SHE70932.1 hypothetical protein SAMN05444274_102166 [Mariniphaga anaerophila]